MSEINKTICTIYKDPELSHKTQYVMTAVRFRGKWVFIRTRGSSQCQMIGGSVRNHETPEAALRRELYEKAGIVAGKLYGVCAYSVSHGNKKIGAARHATTYGKLYFTECLCLGKRPDGKTEELLFSAQSLPAGGFFHPDLNGPLMQKIKSWLEADTLTGITPFAFEKLCGAVTYCNDNGTIKYILIKNLSGHIGFPKGHAENDESELDTAKREVREETGLSPQIFPEFRHSFQYVAPKEANGTLPGADMHKLAVYFAARFPAEEIPAIRIQESEVLQWWLVPYEEAIKILNKNADKHLLELVNRWIRQNQK